MNHGAYQHFLCVSNDCGGTSLQQILEGQGGRAVVLNGSLRGLARASHLLFSYYVPPAMPFVPCVGDSEK